MSTSRESRRLIPSFSQERRILAVRDGVPMPPSKTVPVLTELPERAAPEALAEAVRTFVRRHPLLCHRFTLSGDLVAESVEQRLDHLEFTVIERSALPDDERSVQAYVRRQVDRPFDVFGWPLVRAGLIQSDRPLLYLAFDHLVSDGHSVVVAINEIEIIYRAVLAGRVADLAPAADFFQYSERQRRRYADGPVFDREMTELLARLGGRGVEPPFPVHVGPWDVSAGRYVEYQLLDSDGAARMSRLCRDSRVTMFMAVLAAFGIAAHDTEGCDEVGLLVSTHNREDPVTDSGIGWYSNMLPLYFPPGDAARFSGAMRTVRDALMRLLPYHELPFCRLLEYLPTDVGRLVPGCFVSFVDMRSASPPDQHRRWQQIDLAPCFRMGYGMWIFQRESGVHAFVASPRAVHGDARLVAFENRLAEVLAQEVKC